jgi:Zn-finger protein
MSYLSWIEKHSKKHKTIIDKLTHLSDDEIIEYFNFDNMVINEPDFCPLYKDNKKCHNIDNLNCYLCGCPNFRLDDKKSTCNIDSKYGGKIVSKKTGFIHQDCSKCTVPHNKLYVKKYFNRNWKKIMENVVIN